MPAYQIPRSDIGRLSFMSKTIQTAVIDQNKSVNYIDDDLLADVSAHYAAYNAAHTEAEAALSKRVGESAESSAALDKLKMYLSHTWTSVYNRAQRLELSAGVFGYYKLERDGSRPSLANTRDAWIEMGKQVAAGDAKAVAAGFAAVAEPTAVELQTAVDSAVAEAGDVVSADRDYDTAQANLAAFRPRADELIADVRAGILYKARKMDAPSQRRILRSYGAQYRYLPNEPVDPNDASPDVVEA